ncbi:hypothetical protein D3C87_95000 [compost metagenome]
MKISLDRNKYKKRMHSFWILTCIFGLVAILVLVMNLAINKGVNAERILVILFFGMMSLFFGYLTKFYFSLKKLESVITYEQGILNDFSKPFNKALSLKKEDIQSVRIWSENKGVSQYKLIRRTQEENRNGLVNQLKGNHVFITDYVVDSDELRQLIKLVESEIQKNHDLSELNTSFQE